MSLHCDGELYDFLASVMDELAPVFIVSAVSLERGGEGSFKGAVEGLSVTVAHADGAHCPRCWAYSGTVGSDAKHPRALRALRRDRWLNTVRNQVCGA